MRLINKTISICPVCLNKIAANIIEQEGKIFIQKRCEQHGEFKDLYYADNELFNLFMDYFRPGNYDDKQLNLNENNCPYDCGICNNHKSSTILANIDLTNGCNFKCPVCFANSEVTNYYYHPTFETISYMMDVLRNLDPPCEVIQFSGGEPTIRKDFFDIAKLAKEKGFVHIQVATNGKILAENPDYAQKLYDLKFDTIYLQFDGTTPEPYIKTRGFNALPIKIKAIENIRKINKNGPNIVLVPTVVKDVNDHQIGDIIRFAADNIDVIRGVNFQPLAYTGRISNEDLLNRRITIASLLSSMNEQLDGQIAMNDFLPVTAFAPVLDFMDMIDVKVKYPKLNTHPICGAWTFVFKEGDKLIPLSKIINIKELLKFIAKIDTRSKTQIAAKIITKIHKVLRPGSIKYSAKIASLLKDVFIKRTVQAAANFTNNNKILFIGTMHFMDPYNFDIARLQRCCIHNVTPDGSVIPFCSYNIFYRENVERKFAKKIVTKKSRKTQSIDH
jgi:uncharacterized radical SAM superfamily Fe-S cluster-containing enzyme